MPLRMAAMGHRGHVGNVLVYILTSASIQASHHIVEGVIMGATASIAEFIVNTKASDFPAGSDQKAIKVIADTFAVILAGVGSEVAEPLRRYLDTARESGASPILGTGLTATAETAAMINGTFGHALDYDDVLSMM